jgi:hypothetical protein
MTTAISIAMCVFSALCIYWLVVALRRGSIDIGRGAPILVLKSSPWFWAWMTLYVLVAIGAAFLAAMIKILN